MPFCCTENEGEPGNDLGEAETNSTNSQTHTPDDYEPLAESRRRKLEEEGI